MAWLQTDPSGNFHICFRFGGRKFKRSLKTKSKKSALRLKARLEDTVQLVQTGRIEMSAGVDVPTFLLSDGKMARKHVVNSTKLVEITKAYFESLPLDSLERSTVSMMQIHERHLHRLLGPKMVLSELSFDRLQQYINQRASEKGRRGKTVCASTIRKEIVTLRSLWKWAINTELMPKVEFPSSGLRYPKAEEAPQFQQLDVVESLTRQLDQESNEAKQIWATVFLSKGESEELLDLIREKDLYRKFVYPMFVMAAHTGMRRSELLRASLGDIGKEMITIHEKKRRKGMRSTRRVPISPRLREALDSWLPNQADRQSLFHTGSGQLSVHQMNYYFRKAIADTRFQHLRGWHTLRHSFCSQCASVGIQPAIIDSWVGHSTPEMRRRYQHLFVASEQSAMSRLFAD